MREMTAGEIHSWYGLGQWPCGHGNEYIPGPRGGASLNVECPQCHMKLNVLNPEYGVREGFGQVIFEPAGYVPPEAPKASPGAKTPPGKPGWGANIMKYLRLTRLATKEQPSCEL